MKTREKDEVFVSNLALILVTSCLSLLWAQETSVSSMQVLGFVLVLGGYWLKHLSLDVKQLDSEALSAMTAVKTLFKYESPMELEDIHFKCTAIYELLGLPGLLRVLFDTSLSRNIR